MPQRNPSITGIVRQISEQINRELNDRLPRKVGVMAVNHFNRNFREGGWNDNGLTPWQETIRQREGKGADRRRKPLISAAPHLSRSIEARPRPRAVRIINPVEYARIHNEGGQFTTHPTVTPRMRKMAWAKVYALAGIKRGKKKGKLPQKLPDEAAKWKAIALTKKTRLTVNVNMPKRQFIGDSVELRGKIDQLITETMQKIISNARKYY